MVMPRMASSIKQLLRIEAIIRLLGIIYKPHLPSEGTTIDLPTSNSSHNNN
jgi:hypothetical protein